MAWKDVRKDTQHRHSKLFRKEQVNYHSTQIKKENARTVDDVERYTYAWGDRKRNFTPRQIALAIEVLTRKGWIEGIESGGNA